MRKIALLVVLLAVPVQAQNTDIEALSGLQFDFGNPGARSLGMGGAFLGLADDASAVEANPAGLAVLRKTEVSIEARQTSLTQSFATGGYYPYLTFVDFPAENTGLSFASVVVPVNGFSVALYTHRILEFENEVNILDRYPFPVFFMGPNGPVTRDECAHMEGCVQRQIYPFSTSASVDLSTWGLAMAWSHGRLSLGAGARYHEFREEASSFRVDADAPGRPMFLVTQRNGAKAYGSESDHDLTWIAGAKLRLLDDLSVGVSYKKGPEFPAPVYASDLAVGGNPSLDLIATPRFSVPDVLGAGVSWRPAPAVTLNADVVSIRYSSLASGMASLIEVKYEGGELVEVGSVSGYEADDVLEIHAGVEYFLPTRVPLGLRAGWWRDPGHSIVYRGPLQDDHELAARILFPESEDEDHFSVGMGLALARWQIDAAYDHSDRFSTGSLSAVFRF